MTSKLQQKESEDQAEVDVLKESLLNLSELANDALANRRHSEKVATTKEDVLQRLRKNMQDKIEDTEKRIEELQQKNDQEKKELTEEVDQLKKRLSTMPVIDPGKKDKFRMTQVFEILPGYQIDRTV